MKTAWQTAQKEIFKATVFFCTLCVLSGIAYAAISWPSTPSGETAGGKYGTRLVPTGFIGAFNLSSCPTGWSDYTPAYGRFLRGIDKSGTSIDSAGLRAVGNLQADELKSHAHNVPVLWVAWGTYWAVGNDPMTKTVGTFPTGLTGGAETRPKNVAVLYCVKD